MFRLVILALCSVSIIFSLPTKQHVYKLAPKKFNMMNNRIINGVDAENGVAPWVARIIPYYDDSPDGTTIGSNCGGSLISSNYVLTARHCVMTENNQLISDSLWVSVGDVDYFKGQIIPITEVALFNRYSNMDDVALLRLENDANGIDPIPVQYEDTIDYDGREVTVYGWGTTETGEGSDVLKTTNLVLWGRDDCDASSVCPNPEITNSNVCSGDSGGPMIIDEDGETKLIGVARAVLVINDVPCTGNKAFFTSTSYYADWIQDTIL